MNTEISDTDIFFALCHSKCLFILVYVFSPFSMTKFMILQQELCPSQATVVGSAPGGRLTGVEGKRECHCT